MTIPTEVFILAHLSEAICCRSWPVSWLFRLGRCGYCGQVPTIVGPWPRKDTT